MHAYSNNIFKVNILFFSKKNPGWAFLLSVTFLTSSSPNLPFFLSRLESHSRDIYREPLSSSLPSLPWELSLLQPPERSPLEEGKRKGPVDGGGSVHSRTSQHYLHCNSIWHAVTTYSIVYSELEEVCLLGKVEPFLFGCFEYTSSAWTVWIDRACDHVFAKMFLWWKSVTSLIA